LSLNVMATVRDPEPDVRDTPSQEAFEVAVHGQSAVVVMVAVMLPLAMHGVNSTGATA
jgi:predicted transcriptional regulator